MEEPRPITSTTRNSGKRTVPGEHRELGDWLGVFRDGRIADTIKSAPIIRSHQTAMTDRLWVVTTQFNPAGYRSLAQNYTRFAQHMAESGVNLLTAELTYPGQQATIEGSLRYQAHSIMWHKERLLNLAIKQLPPECDMVAWIDADVLFTNHNWVDQTIKRLQRHPVVQMFEQCIMLDPVGNYYKDAFGFAFSLKSGFLDNPAGDRYTYFNGNFKHPGFAWAARRETIEAWGGLYDRHILGGGDYQMGLALVGDQDSSWYGRFGPIFQKDMLNWSHNALRVTKGNIGYVPGMLMHMWHGHSEDRQYVERSKCLVDYEFDPRNDIEDDDSGLWRWSSPKEAMHTKVADYFRTRKEDHNLPVHPTRYQDKYPVVIDPDGGVQGIEDILEKLAENDRTDFCVHIACYDWQQSLKVKPLIREREWPFQVRMRSTYTNSNKNVPRRLQLIKQLGPESIAKRVILVDKGTTVTSDFIHKISRCNKKIAIDHRGRLLMVDRAMVCREELQSYDCKWGQGEERVVNYARQKGIQIATLDLSGQ